MSATAVRAARTDDLEAVAGLEEVLFGAEAWSVDVLCDDLARPGRRFVVAGGSRVIGHAITMTVGEIADLIRIGVHPDHQRTGVASALLGEVLDAAVIDGADRMLLEVSALNSSAISFYADHGFTQVDLRTKYYKDGSDALVMKRGLGPSCNWGGR